ncbi:MAG: InlB B-repeat-containing protein [Atopobiaceae bacterium]|nr:InlB B-repeat-containing protein [Atopobiaceae bacterium]
MHSTRRQSAAMRIVSIALSFATAAVLLCSCGLIATSPVTVSFDGGGARGGHVASIDAHAGDRITLPENGYEWPNRSFVGWTGGAFSKREALDPGDEVQVDESLTFTAVWGIEVKFDGNGADSGTMESIAALEGDEVELPACAFERKGYEFSHWTTNLSKGEGTKEYQPGDTYPAKHNVTFFANWTRSDGVSGSDVAVTKADEEITGRLDNWTQGDFSCTLKVTNETDATIMLDATFTSLGKAGETKGTATDDARVLGPQESVILYSPEMYKASAVAYTVKASEAPGWMLPISERITIDEVSLDANKLVVSITNTSAENVSVASVLCEAKGTDGTTYTVNAFATGILKPKAHLEATFERHNMPEWTRLSRTYYVEGFAREL